MPMYDFKCPKGHVFESLEKMGTQTIWCLTCLRNVDLEEDHVYVIGLYGVLAHRVLLKAPTWRVKNANSLKMTVHRNEVGEYSFPGRHDAPVAEGYEAVEVTDMAHARRIEKEVGLREHVKAEQHQYDTTTYYDGVRRREQSELRAVMGDFSPRGKQFAEVALKDQAKRSEERSAKRAKDSACYFEALSMDSSNRDAHRDESTSWKGSK